MTARAANRLDPRTLAFYASTMPRNVAPPPGSAATDAPGAGGERVHPILVLALGNDILGDDAAGLLAARALRESGVPPGVEVLETGEAGIALMELMEGRERVLLLDSILTRQCEPGTILELGPEDFRAVAAPSPHYAGLPEVLALAKRLEIPFPSDIRILALEVQDPFEIREGITPKVAAALPAFAHRARQILDAWSAAQSPA